MRHVLHRRRCGVYGDQLDGPAVLVDVDGFRRRRGVLLVAVGQAGFGERDVLDWGGLAVVWLLILVVVRARLGIDGLVFVDDAVARWGADGVRGVDWCGCRSRSRS